MESRIFYFLPEGEPKENEPIQKYSEIFSDVGLGNITTVTYGKIRDRESFILLPEIFDSEGRTTLLIPAILDMFNALSYDGVEYALRMYFRFVEKKMDAFQIVILGTEEESAFWRHCKFSAFLKCPHVRYAINNAFAIKEQLQIVQEQDEKVWAMNWSDCRESLKSINITPPASYKTHHSITNEWSIYRWSKYLGIENVNIQHEIDDFLYFNYLKALYSESDISSNNDSILKGKGKILLVDDEAGKGWSTFFESFCGQSKFQAIGDNFKKMSRMEIVSFVEQVIKVFSPEVVILDLRLHDEDFDVKSPQELTGYIIFEKIKSINKGIQVIVFSASNKIWNYIPLSYDGIVIKESPEQSAIENYTEKCIDALISSIDCGIERGHWLIEVYARIAKISDLISQSPLFQDKKDEILGNLEVAFDLLSKNDYEVNPKYLAYSYLQLYIVVEKFLQEDSIFQEIGKEAMVFGRYIVARWASIDNLTICDYAINNGPKYKLGLNPHESRKNWWKDTHFKMSSVLLFGYGVKNVGNHSWFDIKDVRNKKAGHPETGDVTPCEYEVLLDFMSFIFDERNRQYVPMDYSLPRISSAVVTLVGKDCQAKLNDNDVNLPLLFDNIKPKLKMGDIIDVEVVVNKGKPTALRYIIT